MDNYNEAIEQMLNNGKTPESIYEDALAILKERNDKKVREKRESAIKALNEALITFFKTMGNMSDDEIKEKSKFYLKSMLNDVYGEKKSNSEIPSEDPWLRLFKIWEEAPNAIL